MHQSRTHKTIAHSGAFALHTCPNGPVTLSVGPVSVRLQRDVVEQFRDFLVGAVAELRRQEAASGGMPVRRDGRFGSCVQG